MKRIISLLLISVSLFCSCGRHKGQATTEEEKIWPLGFNTDTLRKQESKVEAGEVFYKLFTRLGMPGEDAVRLVHACDSAFDVRRLRAGNTVDAYYSGDTLAPVLRYVVYERDRINSTVFKCYDSLAVWNVAKQVDTVSKYTDVTIRTSLWNDMTAAGASPLLIYK